MRAGAAGCRAAVYTVRETPQRVPAFPHWFCTTRFLPPRRERRRTIYVDPRGNSIRAVSQEDVRPIGTGLEDRSLGALDLGARSSAYNYSFAFLSSSLLILVLASFLRAAIYPPNARRTVQSVIIRRNTSKIVDSFSSLIKPNKMSLVSSHTQDNQYSSLDRVPK